MHVNRVKYCAISLSLLDPAVLFPPHLPVSEGTILPSTNISCSCIRCAGLTSGFKILSITSLLMPSSFHPDFVGVMCTCRHPPSHGTTARSMSHVMLASCVAIFQDSFLPLHCLSCFPVTGGWEAKLPCPLFQVNSQVSISICASS